jgi:hypothetical protein
MEKKYKFFFHYRKQTGGMTVHFKGKCIPVYDVECRVKCETKRNKNQPRLVISGYCSDVLVEDEKAIIV